MINQIFILFFLLDFFSLNNIPQPAEILQTSATGIFNQAHSSCIRGDKIYLGERSTTPKVVRFNDLDDLSDYTSQTISGTQDLESMVYDPVTDNIYATGYDNTTNYYLDIVEIDPVTLSTYTVHHITNGGSSYVAYSGPSICTDGTYIYGVTYEYGGSCEFFKIDMSTWTIVDTQEWTNADRGHSCQINIARGEMYVTSFGDNMFAKVSLSDLSYSEVDMSSYVTNPTDDFCYYDDGTTCRCYIAGENWTAGNTGGVVVTTTSSNALSALSFTKSYGVYRYGTTVLNMGYKGECVQTVDATDYGTTETYPVETSGYVLNEMVVLNGRIFATHWHASASVLLELLIGDIGIEGSYPEFADYNWNFSNTSTTGNASTTYPLTQNNDLLIMCYNSEVSTLPSTPSGWTLDGYIQDNGISAGFFWKRADGTESGSQIISGFPTNKIVMTNILVFRNCITTGTPFSGFDLNNEYSTPTTTVTATLPTSAFTYLNTVVLIYTVSPTNIYQDIDNLTNGITLNYRLNNGCTLASGEHGQIAVQDLNRDVVGSTVDVSTTLDNSAYYVTFNFNLLSPYSE